MENIQERLRDAMRTGNRALIIELMRQQEEARNNPVEEEEEEERCGDFDQIDAVESKICDGREDPISREVIQDGDGVCMRGNCYSKDSIRESILTRRLSPEQWGERASPWEFSDPITRRPFTMDSFGYDFHRNMVDTLLERLQEVQTRLDLCLEFDSMQADRMAAVLILAASRGDAESVELLLDARANVEATDRDGHTALIVATLEGEAEIVELLLYAGADTEATDNDGNTALMVAALNGDAESVRILLDARAKVEARDRKLHTALILAAANGDAEIVRLLLVAGANVGARDIDGHTALIAAAIEGDAESVRLLLREGADPEATDNNGNTYNIILASANRCRKFRKTKDPKCKDQSGCKWVVGTGCIRDE